MHGGWFQSTSWNAWGCHRIIPHLILNILFYFTRLMHLIYLFYLFIFLFVVNFVIHWNEKALGSHVFPIPIPPPTSLPTRSLQVLPEHFKMMNLQSWMVQMVKIHDGPWITTWRRVLYPSGSSVLNSISKSAHNLWDPWLCLIWQLKYFHS